jgi:tetratricopeptide (TPR) repeat protein
MRWFVLLMGFSFALCLWAQPKNDESRKQAKEEFAKAERYYQLEEYDQALTHYKESYVISGEAVLLYNIGQCYRYLDQNEEALSSYQLFLKQVPKSKYRPNAEAFVKELEPIVAKEREAKFNPDPKFLTPPESQPIKPEIVTLPETQPTSAPMSQALTLPSSQKATKPTDKTPSYRLPLALGGAALIPGGIALGLAIPLARLDKFDAENGANGAELHQKSNIAKGFALSADALFLSAVVFGGITYLKKRNAPEETKQ